MIEKNLVQRIEQLEQQIQELQIQQIVLTQTITENDEGFYLQMMLAWLFNRCIKQGIFTLDEVETFMELQPVPHKDEVLADALPELLELIRYLSNR